MADKRLIDNESSTTVDKFYGNKGGKDVQIPLADAAAVLAANVGIRCIDVIIQAGESYTIPNSNYKALVLLSFQGTTMCVLSLWNRNGIASILYEHSYFGQGEIKDGCVCITKNENLFVLTNKRGDAAKVNCRLLYID